MLEKIYILICVVLLDVPYGHACTEYVDMETVLRRARELGSWEYELMFSIS